MTVAHDKAHADLVQEILAKTDEELAELMAVLDDDGRTLIESIISGNTATQVAGRDANQPWRSDPASMAHWLTNGRLRLWPYVKLLGEKYRQAFAGESIRQIWNLPPRYGKSLYASRWGPAWALDQDPRHRMILVSYGDVLALENATAVRGILREHAPVLRAQLQVDQQAKGRFKTDQGGGLKAAGIRSSITGFPADGLILDDPYENWQQAHSAGVRDSVWNEYQATLATRLESESAYVIICQTRWHEDDITGRMLKRMEADSGESWDLVRLPEIAEEYDPKSPDPLLRVPDLLGRKPGEVLERNRFGLAGIKQKHAARGSYITAGMFQQRPAPEEGGEVKRAWWRLTDSMPEQFDRSIMSWDLKLKDNERGDYVVGQHWGRTGPDFWLTDQLRGQWNQATAENAIALMAVRHPDVHAHHIENAGYGPEVVAALKAPHLGYYVSEDVVGELGMSLQERIEVSALRQRGMGKIVTVNARGSKSVRMRAVSGYIEGGNVHIPETKPWVGAFLDECSAFPRGNNDDQVDAASQGITGLLTGRATSAAPDGQLPPMQINTRGTGTMTLNPDAPMGGPRPGGSSQVIVPDMPMPDMDRSAGRSGTAR